MFDLERSIEAWRRRMRAAGIVPPSLAELENHLREDIQRRRRLGLEADKAFNDAVAAIGPAAVLEREFQKVERSRAVTVVNLVGIAFLAIAGFFSLMIAPKFFHPMVGPAPRLFAVMIVAMTALSWRYGYRLLPALANPWLRAAVGASCCVVAMIWMRCFVLYLLPEIVIRIIGRDTLLGWYFLSFLGAFAIAAVLAGVGHGLEKAARERKAVAD